MNREDENRANTPVSSRICEWGACSKVERISYSHSGEIFSSKAGSLDYV